MKRRGMSMRLSRMESSSLWFISEVRYQFTSFVRIHLKKKNRQWVYSTYTDRVDHFC